MTLTQIKPAGLSKPIDLADNERIRLGDSNDIQIYHDGSNSVFQNATGYLVVKAPTSSALYLQGQTVMGQPSGGGDVYFSGHKDGAFKAYYDNSLKIETTSIGVTVSGDLKIPDGEELRLGNGNDIQLYHDGTHSYLVNNTGNLRIRNNGTVKTAQFEVDQIDFNDSANTEVRVRIGSDGLKLLVDGDKIHVGNGNDLQLYHNGTNSFVDNITGDLYLRNTSSNGDCIIQSAVGGHVYLRPNAGENGVIANTNGAVELYYDNSKKFETYSDGCRLTDSLRISLGTGDDFQLDHDGTYNRILNQHNRTFVVFSNSETALSIGGTNGDISIPGASNRNLLWDKSEGCLGFADNAKAQFGASNDLQIYHDGSHSYINETGTGQLYIRGGASTVCSLQNTINHDIYLQFSHTDHNNSYIGFEDDHFVVYTKVPGQTSHSVRINVDHAGLAFHGDTAAANRLNDYEEGTWTPQLGSHSTITTTGGYDTTENFNSGWYTKIGDLVTVSLVLANIHNNHKGHRLDRILGLPFSATGGMQCSVSSHIAEQRGLKFVYSTSEETSNNFSLWGQIDAGNNYISLHASKHTSPYSGWPATFNVNNQSMKLALQISYRVE